jgi:crossover junction endodeoxyribonuclease RuvC
VGQALILGVDPGSRITGFALIQQQGRQLTLLDSGSIRLGPEPEISLRLGRLQQRLEQVLQARQPQVVAVEDVFTARNARSALLLGQARGAVLAAVGRREIPVRPYAPAMVKRAVTGHGRATKQQMQRMVQVLLSLPRVPGQDEADAMAVAICHALCSRAPAGGRRR